MRLLGRFRSTRTLGGLWGASDARREALQWSGLAPLEPAVL